MVVEELRGADRLADDEYKTVLLAFINCLIISTPELKESTETSVNQRKSVTKGIPMQSALTRLALLFHHIATHPTYALNHECTG